MKRHSLALAMLAVGAGYLPPITSRAPPPEEKPRDPEVDQELLRRAQEKRERRAEKRRVQCR